MFRFISTAACVAGIFAAGTLHAGVIIVTAGSSSLQVAVSQAAPGDLILVQTPFNGPVHIQGKAVSIVADTGANVTTGAIRITGVPSGLPVVIRGVTIDPPSPTSQSADNPAVLIENTTTDVFLEGCNVDKGYPGVKVLQSSSVSLVRCSISGGSPQMIDFGQFVWAQEAMTITDSNLRVLGCEIRGGRGQNNIGQHGFASPGNAAIEVKGGETFIQGGSLIGGAGGDDNSFFYSCPGPGLGGPGLRLATFGGVTPTVRVLDSVVESGPTGAVKPGCLPPTGSTPDIVGSSGKLTFEPGDGNEVTSTSPHREGETLTLNVDGTPGHLAAVLVSTHTSSLYVPGVSSTIHVGSPFASVVVGVVPQGGSLTLLPVVPASVPSLDWTRVLIQAMTCDTTSNACRLGVPSVVALIDAGV